MTTPVNTNSSSTTTDTTGSNQTAADTTTPPATTDTGSETPSTTDPTATDPTATSGTTDTGSDSSTVYYESSDGGYTTADPYDVPDPVDSTATQDTADTGDTSMRDQMLQDLRNQMMAARNSGNNALKKGDSQGMQDAVGQMAQVVQQARPPEAEARKEAKQDEEAKKKQQDYQQVINNSLTTMKTWKQQVEKKTNWSVMTSDTGKQLTQKQIVKSINERVDEAVRQNADEEAKKQGEVAEEKHSLLNQLFQGKKTPNGKPAQQQQPGQKLSQEEKSAIDKEWADIAQPIESECMSETDKQKLAKMGSVKKVKEMANEQEIASARKAKAAQKADGEKVAEDVDAAGEAQSENNEVAQPNDTKLKQVYAAFKESGAITPEQHEKLLKKLADQQAARMKAGAGAMVAQSDEAATQLTFSAYQNQLLAVDEGDEGAQKNREDFCYNVLGGHKSIVDGRAYQQAQKAQEAKSLTSQATYQTDEDGATEKGIRDYGRLVGKHDVFEPTQGMYVTAWESQKDKEDISAARLQAMDDSKPA